MTNPLTYWIFLGLCSVYVLWRGGAPERVAIAIAIIASILSVIALPKDIGLRFRDVELGPFAVDLATLIAFATLALLADRFWPLWITGIHLVGVATHTAKLVDPTVVPRVYGFMQAVWSYPILLIIVAGALRHQKRLKRRGADRSWVVSFEAAAARMRRLGRTA